MSSVLRNPLLALGLAASLAGCPPPVAVEDTGDLTTSSTGPDPSAGTGATPTTGGPGPTTTGASSTSTTLGLESTGDSSGTTGDPGTTSTTGTASTGDTASSTGTASTGDIASSTGDTASTTGPGAEPPPGCDVAVVHVGDLVITDDTDLASLQCIVEVTGRLTIKDTSELVSFAALGNLARVGDDVQIFDNLALADLHGLASLERVDGGGTFGELQLHHNPALTDITGLKTLAQVDAVAISDCDALTDLTGLTGTLQGIVDTLWSLAIYDCDGLTTLDSLTGLTELTGRIYLSGNTKLADISALSTVLGPAVEQITVYGHPALQDLQGLDLVTDVEVLYVIDNDGLLDLSGLESVQQIVPYGLVIEGNAQLATLAGLSSLHTVTEIIIEDNPDLTTLAGLASLTHVPKAMRLGRCGGPGNDALVDLHGLENLVLLNALEIHENDALQSFAAIAPDIGLGGIWAFNNPLLPTAELAAYIAEAAIGPKSKLCNNGGAPEVCECIIIID